MFTCSAGEQNFALDNKLLTGIDRLFFPLSCCLWPPHVSALLLCGGGRYGLCTHTALVQQPSLPRQLQLHPLQTHA